MPVLSTKIDFYKFLKLMKHSRECILCIKIIITHAVKAELQKIEDNCPWKNFIIRLNW